MTDELLPLLRCPEDHSELRYAEGALIDRVNDAIGRGRLIDCAGRAVAHTVEGGLVRAARDRMYPIIDRIPVLLSDDAIPLGQLSALDD